MTTPRISAIAAIGRNRELGKDNNLIWRIPSDLKRVRDLTTEHTIIMGRKTYESIGKPLPNRHNIVITRQNDYDAPGCTVVDSLYAALAAINPDEDEVFIFGGATIYTAALPLTDRLYLTLIDATEPKADSFFPKYDAFNIEMEKETHTTGEGLPYKYAILERGEADIVKVEE